MQEVEEFKEKPRIALTVSCYSLWWGLPLSDSYTLSSTQGLTAKTINQITSQAGLLYKEEWLLKMPGSWIPCPHHYPISSTVTSGSLDPWNALGLWCLAMGHPQWFLVDSEVAEGLLPPCSNAGYTFENKVVLRRGGGRSSCQYYCQRKGTWSCSHTQGRFLHPGQPMLDPIHSGKWMPPINQILKEQLSLQVTSLSLCQHRQLQNFTLLQDTDDI